MAFIGFVHMCLHLMKRLPQAMVCSLTLFTAQPSLVLAKDITVAVAANFTEPAKEIAQAFEAKTGTHVVMSFGPSGGFLSQIEQSAPYEVFLSADSEHPAKLEADGFSVAGKRFTYALGTLVLWSRSPGYVDPRGEVLAKGQFSHLAMADPASAPYGIAAFETLKSLGLYDKVSGKIVKGTSIAQTYTFVDTGAAELGFIALSQIYRSHIGSYWYVPRTDYSPIVQQAVLLKTGASDSDAKAYFDFLKSPQALRIIKSYGYDVR